MVAMPDATPVTIPVRDPTVAIPGAPPDHVPPGLASARTVVADTQRAYAPVTGAAAITLIALVMKQPPIEYVMVAGPTATPVTTPVAVPMVSAVPKVLQMPPVTVSASVTVKPVHTDAGPEIAVGVALTVILFVAKQPEAPTVYVMPAIPPAKPDTTPEVAPIVATDVAPLVQVPPGVTSVHVVVVPEQRLPAPDMAAGAAVTDSVLVTMQPEPNEYEMTVVPAVTPVTMPLSDPIVTLPVLLVHVPPGTVLPNAAVAPTQTAADPVTGPGAVLTVSVVIVLQPVGNV